MDSSPAAAPARRPAPAPPGGTSGSPPERLVVVGQGYVGLPLAMAGVDAGFDVVGLEADPERVKRLEAGDSYIEDVPSERLAAALAGGRYRATSDSADAAGFDHAVISVPTPLRDGCPDLSHIESAGRSLAPHLRPGATVVLESTTWPGTTQELLGPLLEEGSGLLAGADFSLGYSPERIDPGNPVWTLQNTPKVVSGVDALSLTRVQGLFDRLVETTVPVSSPREAELTKLLENTFRHVNVALVNELAMFAHDLGIDVWEAIDAASTKPFGYLRFTPGPGVGGHCLPIDPSYLSWQVKRSLGHSFRFVELANDVNEHMPEYVVRRVVASLNARRLPVRDRQVLLLGLSYKRGTGDTRESPSRAVAAQLVAMGARVHAVDPCVSAGQEPPDVVRVDLTEAELRAADLVLLLVDHAELDLDAVVRHSSAVLDTRHVLPAGPTVEHL